MKTVFRRFLGERKIFHTRLSFALSYCQGAPALILHFKRPVGVPNVRVFQRCKKLTGTYKRSADLALIELGAALRWERQF
jgi:hypothetical protein